MLKTKIYRAITFLIYSVSSFHSFGQKLEVVPQEQPGWYIYDLMITKDDGYVLYAISDHPKRTWHVVDYKRQWQLYKISNITAITHYKNQVVVAQNNSENSSNTLSILNLSDPKKNKALFNNIIIKDEIKDIKLSNDHRFIAFLTIDSVYYGDIAKNKILSSAKIEYNRTTLLGFNGKKNEAIISFQDNNFPYEEKLYLINGKKTGNLGETTCTISTSNGENGISKKLITEEEIIVHSKNEIVVLHKENLKVLKRIALNFNKPRPLLVNQNNHEYIFIDIRDNDTIDKIYAIDIIKGNITKSNSIYGGTFWFYDEDNIALNDTSIIGFHNYRKEIVEINTSNLMCTIKQKNTFCDAGNMRAIKTNNGNNLLLGDQCGNILNLDMNSWIFRDFYPKVELKSIANKTNDVKTKNIKEDWSEYNFCSNKLIQIPQPLDILRNENGESEKYLYKFGDTAYVKDIEKDIVVAKFDIGPLAKDDVSLLESNNKYFLVWQFKNDFRAAKEFNDPDYKKNRIILHIDELNASIKEKVQILRIPINWEMESLKNGIISVTSPTSDSLKIYSIKNGVFDLIHEFNLDYKKIDYSPFIDTAYINEQARAFNFIQDEIDDFTGDTIKKIYKYEVNSNKIITSPNGEWIVQYSYIDSALYNVSQINKTNLLDYSLSVSNKYNEVEYDIYGNEVGSELINKSSLPPNLFFWEFLPWNNNQLLIRSKVRFCIFDLKQKKVIYSTGETLDKHYIDYKNQRIHFVSSDSLFIYDSKHERKFAIRKSQNGQLEILNRNILKYSYTELYNYINNKTFSYYTFPKLSLIINSDNYYMSTGPIKNELIFRIDTTYYEFEQFDLKYNRPDIIINELSCEDTILAKNYYNAYTKRLKKLGIQEKMLKNDFDIPYIKINEFKRLNDFIDTIQLNLDIKDNKYKLDRINIFINDVPVYGSAGIDLRKENTQSLQKKISLQLSEGQNKIQVSVLNQAGAESYKETAYVTYKPKQSKKPDLYLVTIGDSKYADTRFDLTYAAKDAEDIKKTFEGNSSYSNLFAYSYTNEKVTRENILKLKNELKKAKRDDVVIITVAGHGVLDKNLDYYLATYDMDFNNPSGKGIPYEELESLVDGIAPLKKVIFLDACHSGEVDKEEVEQLAVNTTSSGNVKFRTAGAGIQKKNLGLKTTSELMSELFTDLRKGTGATVISSAGGAEYAMESDQWKNGLFTYCLLHGLKDKAADANGDDQIMLSELQNYLRKEVTTLSNGAQQPTSRIENLTMDFRVW